MIPRRWWPLGLGLVTTGIVAAVTFSSKAHPAGRAHTQPPLATMQAKASAREPLQPLAAPAPVDASKVELGRALFTDKRLSADDSLACIDCHDLGHGGADARPMPIGIHGRVGTMNTPTVFNADLNVKQFWDGRADSLEDQIDGPVQHPNEMGSTWGQVVTKLQRDPEIVAGFRRVSRPITPESIKDALATYERTLVTTDARFDRYLGGDRAAITDEELRGYELFKSYGCVSCHQGRNVGGNVFERLGVMRDYFAERGEPVTESDLGRYNVTKRPADRFRFRVPSLRLVTLTAPYFHDGRTAKLEDAIALMGEYQLGVDIPESDRHAIAAFLGSLAGTYEPAVRVADR